MLALTPSDFLFETNELSITKSYQRLGCNDVITDPKTPKSIRRIAMPKFLAAEMKEYLELNRTDLGVHDRIFAVSKHYLSHEMDRDCKTSGVKRIRIHDLRHSHVSLLIEMGFSALAIAERVGHESTDITYRYAHLFPSKLKSPTPSTARRMISMPRPNSARKRSKTMAFRMTPEEYERVAKLAEMSDMDRQEFIMSKLMDHEIVMTPSTRVYKALKDEMSVTYQSYAQVAS